jgi:Flp pilus assembly protein TadG
MKRRSWSEAVRRDDGVYAILFAVTIVLIFAFAALALDLATFYQNKQQLQNTNDAAALAGAAWLPLMDPAQAAVAASVTANDPGLPTPAAVFYCVVASTLSGSTYVPDPNQVGTSTTLTKLCYPGGTGYVPQCNETICAIPCISATCKPNVIRVGQDANVRFSFAPVIGIASGRTNVVESVACKGTCGQAGSNPMDVVVIADRTGSISNADLAFEQAAIKNMLLAMEPSIQRVALGAVGWSNESSSCRMAPRTGNQSSGTFPTRWIPVGLRGDYRTGNTLVASSAVVAGLSSTCLTQSGSGTQLATPLRVAARYLLGSETGITGGVGLQSGATKAIIFETDGDPNENVTTSPSTVTENDALSSSANLLTTNKSTACSNFTNVATAAKAKGILLAFVTLGSGGQCDLGGLASTDSNGNAMHYTTTNATDLHVLYETALGAISGKSRLIKLPS